MNLYCLTWSNQQSLLRNLSLGDSRVQCPGANICELLWITALLPCLLDFVFPQQRSTLSKEVRIKKKSLCCTLENDFIEHPVTQAKIFEVILDTSLYHLPPCAHHQVPSVLPKHVSKLIHLHIHLKRYYPGPSCHSFSTRLSL